LWALSTQQPTARQDGAGPDGVLGVGHNGQKEPQQHQGKERRKAVRKTRRGGRTRRKIFMDHTK